jgi:hypothetical protein
VTHMTTYMRQVVKLTEALSIEQGDEVRAGIRYKPHNRNPNIYTNEVALSLEQSDGLRASSTIKILIETVAHTRMRLPCP